MMPKNILVPTDFSACAEEALDYACQLAERFGAMIYLVNAISMVGDLPLTSAITSKLERERMVELDHLASSRRGIATFATPQVTVGDPRDVILSAAHAVDADLIVVGTHGRRGISRILLGSVAEEVLRRAPCPVLTVRTKSSDAS